MNHNSVILVPTYKYIEPETEKGLRALESRGYRVERRFGLSSIDAARSILATWAWLEGFEWLYWIDSDTDFDVKDFESLESMAGLFSCAPYQVKLPGGRIAALGEFDALTTGIVEIDAAGCGFMKTHRSIYEALSKTIPMCQQSYATQLIPFFQPGIWEKDGIKIYHGDDYSFCLRAKDLGFKLMANFDIEIGHIGRYAYRIREVF